MVDPVGIVAVWLISGFFANERQSKWLSNRERGKMARSIRAHEVVFNFVFGPAALIAAWIAYRL